MLTYSTTRCPCSVKGVKGKGKLHREPGRESASSSSVSGCGSSSLASRRRWVENNGFLLPRLLKNLRRRYSGASGTSVLTRGEELALSWLGTVSGALLQPLSTVYEVVAHIFLIFLPLAGVTNGESSNLLNLRLTSHANEQIVITKVHGQFHEAGGRERPLRNVR